MEAFPKSPAIVSAFHHHINFFPGSLAYITAI